MAEGNEEHLGMDASDLIGEIGRVNEAFRSMEDMIRRQIRVLDSAGKDLDSYNISIKAVNDTGTQLSATLKKGEDGWTATGRAIKTATDALTQQSTVANRNARAIQARINAMKQERDLLLELASARSRLGSDEQALSGAEARRREEERRNAVLREQQTQYNRLRDDAARMVRYEQERLDRMNQQLAVTKLLQAARSKSDEQARAAARAERLGGAAAALGGRLQRQFITPSPASAQEVAAVTSTIGKIQQLVATGQIAATRVRTILRSVQSGSGQIFTGIERQVADLGIRLQSASGALGAASNREISQIEQNNRRARNAFQQAGRAAEQAGRRAFLTWRDFSRILAIQFLHNAVSRFVALLGEGTQTAAQFQVRIGEIRTISHDAAFSFERWSNAVRGLSDQFGNPILDVAEGVYETISNQIADGGKAAEFMGKALAFSQATVSTSADSVNLLSSAINAYRLDLSKVDEVADSFFETINLGRVRASDLANEFGRVAPVAASLGITLNELNAAIAAITIQGVTPSETLTSIFGIMNKLLKPTDEMVKFLESLGFSSGQAAIRALGFAGVLREVTKQAQAGNVELADLFNEIRSTRGIVAITRALDTYDSALQSLNNSQGAVKKAQDEINATAGKQFQIEMNKIKNIFAEDFGRPFISFLLNITSSSNEAGERINNLAGTVRTLTEILSLALKTYLAYKSLQLIIGAGHLFIARSIRAETAARRLSIASGQQYGVFATGVIRSTRGIQAAMVDLSLFTSRRTLGIGLSRSILPLTVFAGIALSILQKQKEIAEDATRGFDEAQSRMTERVEEQTKSTIDAGRRLQTQTSAQLDARIKRELQYAAESRKIFNQLGEEQATANKKSLAAIKDQFDLFIDSVSEGINKLKEQARVAAENIKNATRSLFEQQENLTSGRFGRQLKLLPPKEQIQAEFAEISRLQKESAAKLQQKFTNADTAKQALEESNKLLAQADRLTNDLMDRQVDLTKRRKELTDQITDAEKRQQGVVNVREQRAQLEQIRRLEAEVRSSQGKRKSAILQELAARKQAAQQDVRGATDKEADRARADKLAELRDEAALIDTQLQQLAAQGDLNVNVNKELDKRKGIYQSYINQNATIQTQAEQQEKVEQKRLESLKTIFESIAKFKVPNIKNVADAQKAFAQLDEQIKQATLLKVDQNVLFQLINRRTELEKQANIEIAQHRLETMGNALSQEQDNFKKQQGQLVQQAEDAVKARQTAINTLFDISGRLKSFAPSQSFAESTVARIKDTIGLSGTVMTQGLRQEFANLEEALKTLDLKTSVQNVNQVQDIFGRIMIELTQRAGGFTGAIDSLLAGQDAVGKLASQKPENVIIGQQGGKTITLTDVQKQFDTMLRTLLVTAQQSEARKQAEKALKEQETRLNLQNEQYKKQLTTNQQFIDANRLLADEINKTGKNLGELSAAIEATRSRLLTLIPNPSGTVQKAGGGYLWRPRGTDRIPSMLTAGEYVVNAESTRHNLLLLEAINSAKRPLYRAQGGLIENVTSGRLRAIGGLLSNDSVNIEGGIHVHGVPVGKSSNQDLQAIAHGLNRGLRLKTIRIKQ